MKTHPFIVACIAITAVYAGVVQGQTSSGSAAPREEKSVVPARPSTPGGGGVAQALPPGGAGGAVPVPFQMPPPPLIPPPSAGVGGMGTSAGAGGGPSFATRLQNIIARASSAEPAAGPLVLRFSEDDPALQSRLLEDLGVMSLILHKAVGGSGGGAPGRAMGVDLAFAPGAEGLRDLYIEGYGALFTIKVPFPLVAPSGKPDSGSEDATPDSEWEKAKRELQGGVPEPAVPPANVEPYRAERVNQLKDALISALINAQHIRDLKQDEAIAVCIIGSAATGPGPRIPMPVRAVRRPADARPEAAVPPSKNETFLTMKVKKADIDRAAKGNLDTAAFRNSVQLLTY